MRSFTKMLSSGHFAQRTESSSPFLIVHDRVICRSCVDEVLNPSRRRYRYPFAHCTHCGPRLTVMHRLPYHRANTAMDIFERCASCMAEYADPTNRHYRDETIICPRCGPRATLVRLDERPVEFEQQFMLDDVDAACSLIQKGEVVAIKGIGGYQLACDATNAAAVVRLRRAKQNGTTPMPLMARDLHVIARYCAISVEEEVQLTNAQGSIVLLRATGEDRLPEDVAPGLTTLGFMLPTTALHLLLLQRMSRPVVMTSGNLSGEPQIIDDAEARAKLGIAMTYALIHNHPIVTRLDDSVVRVMAGRSRILRRARGYAPSSLKLPAGFERASGRLLALGSDGKTMFCLVRDSEVIPSPYYGALPNQAAIADYRDTICHYRQLLDHEMSAIMVDTHPQSLSAQLARDYAAYLGLRAVEVQHPHAHVAACLAENNYPLDAPPVLGIVLDGRGWGGEADLWGSEFLLCDYRECQRVATLKPVTTPSGEEATDEPWRSLYAQLTATMPWRDFVKTFRDLELCRYLKNKPRDEIDAIIRIGAASRSSSCGRLLEAAAAALGLCRDRQAYDGEAAMRIEANVDQATLRENDPEHRYPVALTKPRGSGLPSINPAGMWRALFADLARDIPAPVIAARFHMWLATALSTMARNLAGGNKDGEPRFTSVALSGGCFQNRVLLEETMHLLRQEGFNVLSHSLVPSHDGGLAFGQAAIGAAQLIAEGKLRQ